MKEPLTLQHAKDEVAKMEKKMIDSFKAESSNYRDPDCFIIGCGFGAASSRELHNKVFIDSLMGKIEAQRFKPRSNAGFAYNNAIDDILTLLNETSAK